MYETKKKCKLLKSTYKSFYTFNFFHINFTGSYIEVEIAICFQMNSYCNSFHLFSIILHIPFKYNALKFPQVT